MRFWLSLIGALMLLSSAPMARANADPPPPGCIQTGITQVAAGCTLTGTQTGTLFATSGSSGDGHDYDVRPQCGDDLGGDAVCYGGQPCIADDGQPGFEMDLYRDGVVYGETCLSEAQAGGLGVITPAMVIRQFKRIAWPQSPLSIQPPGLKTAVNFETYYFTDNTEPSSQVVQIIGQDVEIEATPVSYLYRFDDQDATETDSAGAPYPDGDVTHTYLYKGAASPSLDTVYAGRYRVNGSRWVDIAQTVTVPGAPVALEIIEIRPTLVAPGNP